MARADYATQVEVRLPGRPTGYASGALVQVEIETRALIASGAMRRDRRDLRMFYGELEIARIMRETGKIRFRLQASVAAGTEVTGYWLAYGRPAEATDPPQDPREVYPYFADGDDLASLTTTGSVTTFAFPKPGFIKQSGSPQFPAPSPPQYNNRDAWGFVWDPVLSRYWLFFGGGPARSVDLYSWEIVSWPEIAASPRPSTNGGVIANLSPLFQTVIGGQTKWVGVAMNGGLMIPWYLEGLTADTIAGPWTWTNQLVPADQWYDANTTGAGGIWPITVGPHAGKFLHVYGCMTNEDKVRRGTAIGLGTEALGPFTKYGPIEVPHDSEIENPDYIFDDSTATHFITAAGIGLNVATGPIERMCAIPLYWATDPLSVNGASADGWSATKKTTIIEPEVGRWDSYTIGMPSRFVTLGGMCYLFYDGGDLAAFQADLSGNLGHSVGEAEAPWPFPWANAIKVTGGGSVETPAILAGDGTIKARVRFPVQGGTHGFGVKSGASSYYLRSAEGGFDIEGTPFDSPLETVINGVAAESTVRRAHNHTRTVEFQRVGSTLTIRWSGWTVWEGAATTGDLAVRGFGEVVVEDVLVEQDPVSFSAPQTHTIRAEAGAAEATVELVPGADVPTGAIAAEVSGPSLSAAPAWPAAVVTATLVEPTISAAPALPVSSVVATLSAPEILSPDTGHRLRGVAGAFQAVALLVPGADVPQAVVSAGAGAWALSAEVAFPTAAATAALVAPQIHLPLPSSAAVASLVAPALSGDLGLPASAVLARFIAPALIDGTAPVVPDYPWHPGLGRLPRPWWTRRQHRGIW